MKKILLASTILAASAGVAAAEVTVRGDARMGVTYAEDFLNEDTNELAFSSRIRISFTASGETDGGLAFGGSIRADNAAGGAAGTAGSFFISGAFGKLTMGDVAGAAEFVVGDLAGVGFQDLGSHHENIYLSNNRRSAARYEYTTGSLTFAVSADNPGLDGANVNYAGLLGGTLAEIVTPAALTNNLGFGVGAAEVVNAPTENTYSIGVKYAVDAYAVSLGYETTKVDDERIKHIIAGVEGTFSGVTVKATYGQADGLGDFKLKQMGLSASYKMDALTVRAYHRQEKVTEAGEPGSLKFTATGIGAAYDLGGGASLVGGLVQRKLSAGGESSKQNLADLGVTFTF